MQVQSPEVSIRHYRYNKNRKLGKGATGSVYLGVDTRTGQQVAVKVINMKDIDNEVKRYLLLTETHALQGLKHPNIIRCLDVIQQPSNCYFVTEFCPEGTLGDYIKQRGQVPESDALTIFRGIVGGCRAMVQNGVTHRDLKPSNILMVEGHPKITDFGFCDIAGSIKPKMFYNVGSPSYMSPQAYMDNFYSEKSEVWAIGCILYEMLVGNTIDTGRKITDLYDYLKAGKSFIPNGISPFSKALLTECLRFDPRKRINVVGVEKMLNSALGPVQHTGIYKSAAQSYQAPQIQVPQGQLVDPQVPFQHPPAMLVSPASPTHHQQEIMRQHSRAPQIKTSSLIPPGGIPNQPRGLMTSVGNLLEQTPYLTGPMHRASHSKGTLPLNVSHSRNSYPTHPLNGQNLKGSLIDEDSWLARQLRQKEMMRQNKSMIQNISGVPMMQSIRQPSPPHQLGSMLQPPGHLLQNLQPPLTPSEMARPFAASNHSPELPLKVVPNIPIVATRGAIGATRFLNAPRLYR